MGTHSAIHVTHPNGGENKVERTMDGNQLIALIPTILRDVADGVAVNLEDYSEGMGNGSTEWNELCEGEEDHWIYINYKAKAIWTSSCSLNADIIGIFDKLAIQQGWSIDIGKSL